MNQLLLKYIYMQIALDLKKYLTGKFYIYFTTQWLKPWGVV